MIGALKALATLVLAVALVWQGSRIIEMGVSPVPPLTLPPITPPQTPQPGPSQDAAGAEPDSYRIIESANLFHPDRKPVAEEPTPAAPEPPQTRAAAKTEQVILLGVLLDGSAKRALVRVGQRTDLISVVPGDEVAPGVRVKEISIGGMSVVEEGDERFIKVQGDPGGAMRASGQAAAVPQQPAQQTGTAALPARAGPPRSPRTVRRIPTPPGATPGVPAIPGIPGISGDSGTAPTPIEGMPFPIDVEIREGPGFVP